MGRMVLLILGCIDNPRNTTGQQIMLGEEAAKASNGIPMRIGNPNRTLTPRPNPSYSIQLRGCITVMANI
jgi:hypothetical protein